jgi:L-aspartate oxidase
MREKAGVAATAAEPPQPQALFPCAAVEDVRRMAWENCGIARSADQLRATLEWLDRVPSSPAGAGVAGHELRNIHQVVRLIAQCALAREESRGAHYRIDFPDKRPAFQRHSCVRNAHDVTFR